MLSANTANMYKHTAHEHRNSCEKSVRRIRLARICAVFLRARAHFAPASHYGYMRVIWYWSVCENRCLTLRFTRRIEYRHSPVRLGCAPNTRMHARSHALTLRPDETPASRGFPQFAIKLRFAFRLIHYCERAARQSHEQTAHRQNCANTYEFDMPTL